MKKVIFILMVAMSITTVYGQSEKSKKGGSEKAPKGAKTKGNAKTPEERADVVTAKLKEVLTLSDEQVPKVKAITLTRINSIKAAKVTAKDNKEAFGQERKKVIQTWNTSLKEIITPEQLAKLKAYREEKRKAKKEGKEKGTSDDEDDSIEE